MFTPQKPQNYFFSQVHQPFFLSGIIFATVVMLMFMLSYKGILPLQVESTTFHSYSLIYIVFTQFFTGFIFTTFPRFCQTEVIEKSYYLRTWALHQLGAVVFLAGAVLSIEMLYVGISILLVANTAIVYKLRQIYAKAPEAMKHDPQWILVGFSMGLFAHFLYLLAFADIDNSAVAIAVNLYLVYTTFAVGQRMVPFFSHSFADKNEQFAPTVFAGLVLKVVAVNFEFSYLEILVDIALGLYIAMEVKRWALPFRGSPAILKILHISLYWLIGSLLIGGFVRLIETVTEMNFMQMDVHMLVIGFVTTMLIGFGTRVTLGHSGQPPHADSTTLKIFYLLQVVVIGRILFSLEMGFNANLFWMFDLSVTLWLLLFIFWGVRFGPTLVSGKKL
ncbi:MAG: NnrS family protein [Sulfurimonadaceae bacterium]